MKTVTIVIPTRNRAHLLRFALKSAVKQSYSDVEIIVCDNDSTDATKSTVDSFKNAKVTYVRTQRVLSMPDNWEFALSQARGEYITFLPDDAYLLPDAIATAVTQIERFRVDVIVWKHSAYFGQDWLETARRNLLYIPKVSGGVSMIESRLALEHLYNNCEQVSTIIPKFLNSLCCRSVIERILKIQGRLFLPPCPDYTSAAGILLNVPRYILLDLPLYIDGVTPSSIGATASFNLGRSATNFVSEFEQGLDAVGFLGIPTSTSAIGKSLETVRCFYRQECPELNYKALLSAIADRLVKLECNGAETEVYWQKLRDYVGRQPLAVRAAVLRQKAFSRVKWWLIRTIRSSPELESLERLRGIDVLRGSEWKFDNIEDCVPVVRARLGI